MQLFDNENQMLKILQDYQNIDMQSEEIFNDLVQLAVDFCDTPVAIISVVDTEREWFKSKIGVTISEVPGNVAFGSYTIQQNEIFIIHDTWQDQRFAAHPLVISNPSFRFYAGVPLINSSGLVLGCLSVMDVIPRNLSIKEQKALQGLAKQVIRNIELNFQKSGENNRIRDIIQAIPLPLMIFRVSDGLILYANPEFMQTFQIDAGNLYNTHISNIYNEVSELNSLIVTLSNNGYLHNQEILFHRKDGSLLWAITSLQYLKLNNEIVILIVFYDITNRKNTETALQEQNKFLQSIFQSIPLMIALNDVNGKVQWVNYNLEQTLGWTLKDFHTHDVFAELYPDAKYRQYVIDCMKFAQPVWSDFKCRLRDGFTLDTSWTNISLPNGQTLSIGQDITARKQTEQAFQAQAEREQLMRTVSQRIRQSLNLQDILNATVKEVQDLLQVDRVVVYQFASDMSGKIMAESVTPGWTVSLGVEIKDTCFQSGAGLEYHQGRRRAIANIDTAGLSDCHLNLLAQFQVKANLVVPILLTTDGDNSVSCLWGLLIAHQCSAPRDWEENQLDLLEQLTVQIAIAIQQSSIFEQSQIELAQRQQAEIELRSALAEKEVLLKEVHHRVKNNLQIVSSLLQLQAQTLKEPEIIRVIQESQNRIESISLIHKNLYTSPNIGQLDIFEYINNLASGLLISYQIVPSQISLLTDIDSVSLNVDEAIACGLIINELVSNALKHAFPNNQKGKINISLRNVNNKIELTVQDNGVGLPDGLYWRNTDSLGLSLVYDLVTEQLEGNITVESNQGTLFHIQFPQLTLHKSIANGAS
ncbi:GAF domain-containing protein [Sphaerospermopsis aphanizomenoides BCCUSP55]|uniref:GAF domain-containing protein n=1 Tax=Sphaerospermopsis aphanizomenoides TaxID=459663 RepID=UPI001908D1A5|nr:GAF domain-containing protein [Sphaerospermopsis aphanizomenoides]MBK1990210.1 GAF domain-containing protein [Sphaerospermopsis aphanizomenoides BCCUSP55]